MIYRRSCGYLYRPYRPPPVKLLAALMVVLIVIQSGLSNTEINPLVTEKLDSNADSTKIVTYINEIEAWWPPTTIAGGIGVPGFARNSSYNVINLAFWLSTGPVDVALVWSNALFYVSNQNPWGTTTAAVQSAWKTLYHNKGIKVLISAFGATEFPTSGGVDPRTCAENLASFVKANNLDGVDLDWEDNGALEQGTGEQWLTTITTRLRELLPRSEGYIISHAPQAPYFTGTSKYPNGGYTSLFETANGWAVGTAVKELMQKGIPKEKIVVGKPVARGDVVNTGYVAPNDLGAMLRQGVTNLGWRGGVMGWQYKSDTDGSWSKTMARNSA